uniref:Transmembrane protein n=1 Tax=Glossina palpalis gambiensis TaxID=67801 RepID=A0A1B0B091_9MUSC
MTTSWLMMFQHYHYHVHHDGDDDDDRDGNLLDHPLVKTVPLNTRYVDVIVDVVVVEKVVIVMMVVVMIIIFYKIIITNERLLRVMAWSGAERLKFSFL